MYGTWALEWVNVIQPSTAPDQLCLGYATEIYGLLVTTESTDYLTTFTSPAFIACRLLDSSHSDWREMVPHSGFDLHFSDNE